MEQTYTIMSVGEPTKLYEGVGESRRQVVIHAIAHGVDFKRADLRGIDLSNTDLVGVDFTGANLEAARFCSANLFGACFERAKLKKAIFTGALITAADFSKTDLSDTGFDLAEIGACKFSETKFANDAQRIKLTNQPPDRMVASEGVSFSCMDKPLPIITDDGRVLHVGPEVSKEPEIMNRHAGGVGSTNTTSTEPTKMWSTIELIAAVLCAVITIAGVAALLGFLFGYTA